MIDVRENMDTLQAIDSALEKKKQPRRGYMGVSSLGTKCDYALWLQFRWAVPEQLSGRVIRLLDRGHREEAAIVKLLKMVGVDIRATGSNQMSVECTSWVRGHCDGIIYSGLKESSQNVHVAEFKTANDKAWNELKKNGLIKAKPEHYAQLQSYMYGLGIERGFYWCVNKNTDEVYTERVYLDRPYAARTIQRGHEIALSEKAPARLSCNPSWWECKTCRFYDFCYGDQLPVMSCRTCKFCTFQETGEVLCKANGQHKSLPQQIRGCSRYKVHPGMTREELSEWLK